MNNLDYLVDKVLANREKKLISGKTGLTVLIEPVSRCNLACRYCVADGWKQNEKIRVISRRTLDDYLTKIANYTTKYNISVEVIMHGYEPLQAGIELFGYVQDKVKELGMKAVLGVQTNGVLVNDEWADFFVKNNWRVGFSIDGPREYHDANRVFPNGKGTYDLATRGYKIYAEKRGKPTGIISVITSAYRKPSLEESVERYYRWLEENNIPSANLHLASTDPRNPYNKQFAMSDEEYAKWFTKMYYKWSRANDGRVIRPFDGIIEAMVKGRARWGVCYLRNGCWRVISISWNGIVHLCDRWSYIGKHISQYRSFEDILKDRFMRIQALRPYMLRRYDLECSKCKYFNICQGGCANEGIYNYYLTGHAINGIPQWSRTQHCKFYKAIFQTIEEDLKSKGIKLRF